MILSAEQREGVHKMLSWVETHEGALYEIKGDRVRDKEYIKDQLLKVLLLDEYDKRDKELLNAIRKVYLDSNSVDTYTSVNGLL
jgi:hypothetical protein